MLAAFDTPLGSAMRSNFQFNDPKKGRPVLQGSNLAAPVGLLSRFSVCLHESVWDRLASGDTETSPEHWADRYAGLSTDATAFG